MKTKLKDVAPKQAALMTNLGFSLEKKEEIYRRATWVRRIGEPGKLPIYPKVEISLEFEDVPCLMDIARKIIKATVEAQQERSARALSVITGRRA